MTRYPDGVQQPRPRGRPRVDEPLEPVMVRLPQGVYEQICREALHREMKVSAFLRHIVVMRLPPKP